MKPTSPLVITISRQLGSGGAYIGQRLAKAMKLFYADREIISQAAKQLSLYEEDLASRDEKVSSFWQSYLQSYALGVPESYIPPLITLPTDNALFEIESEVIKQIVKERAAVIIGRCGAHVLQDYPNHFSLFLYGDVGFRKNRVQKVYNVTEEVAGKMIVQSDKERANYNHKFTGKDWTDATQYDLAVDTSKIGLDKSIEVIMKYLE